jgi:ComF family protein
VAYGAYDGVLRELIHLLKYGQVRPAAPALGRMLASCAAPLLAEFGGRPVLLLPVPLHRSKARQRGFNQAALIAREMRKSFPPGCLELNLSALRRRRATGSQIGLSREQRRRNLQGAFAVERPAEIAGREILLVDDVYTTGTTVSECAHVLRRAGAARVWVATVARVEKYSVFHPAPRDAVELEVSHQQLAVGT